MRLGIDFGTTRTSVAAVDRGNYPIVSFQTIEGDTQEWYPSLIAARGGRRLYGIEALSQQHQKGWVLSRSFKRLLASAAPDTLVQVADETLPLLDLLTEFLRQLRQDLGFRSNLQLNEKPPPEIMIGVPANANSNQRFITLEAFRRAGFCVLGMVNEPSAAGIEYAYRFRKAAGARKEYLAIYDLGGGTFDASVIRMTDRYHEVVTSQGLAQVGGDDFDQLLLELVLAGLPKRDSLPGSALYKLREECREKKEGLHPNSRKMVIDLTSLGDREGEVVLSTSGFYERCRPLVYQTLVLLERVIAAAMAVPEGSGDPTPPSVYRVGGSSDLPVVARALREHYGTRVFRSPYPHAATAIGLGIAADQEAGYVLKERFTRHFGVWREAAGGQVVSFDPIFIKDTALPNPGEAKLIHTYRYQPAHNIGHFRYVECGELKPETQPAGETMPWDEVYFPFDPALSGYQALDGVPIVRRKEPLDQTIEESYSCDAHGIIEVVIANRTAGYARTYRLRRPLEALRERSAQR